MTDSPGDLSHDFVALDLAYDWYPLGRELYRGFELRGMLLRSWLDLEDGSSLDTWGSYLYGQFKIARRWIVGVPGRLGRGPTPGGSRILGALALPDVLAIRVREAARPVLLPR